MMEFILSKKLHHVGYIVADLEAYIAAMKPVLEPFTYAMYDFIPQNAWGVTGIPYPCHLKIAMLKLEGESVAIEIIQPLSNVGYHADVLQEATTTEGIHHLCYQVDNKEYEAYREYVAGQKAVFVFESETEDELVGYRRCFYAKIDNKFILEIKETPYFRTKK